MRAVPRFPFVPDDEARLAELCFEAFNIQSHGLRQRLRAAKIDKVVIGVSGGARLDACAARRRRGDRRTRTAAREYSGLYAARLRNKRIEPRTTPGRLMRALGVSAQEIDMTPACRQMLADISHPAARGEPVYDTTYENVQAGARTSLLFRLANQHDAIVIGTGDLSELALGWCTYGVGDQMSHYNVNASVPKTLIQHLIRWCARDARFGAETVAVLHDILDTEISPELVPGESGAVSATPEDVVGPYALQDFNLFYTTRYGFTPSKIAFLELSRLARRRLRTPGLRVVPQEKRVAYDLVEIKHWLGVFLRSAFSRPANSSARRCRTARR